jgi:hypothetical protein
MKKVKYSALQDEGQMESTLKKKVKKIQFDNHKGLSRPQRAQDLDRQRLMLEARKRVLTSKSTMVTRPD